MREFELRQRKLLADVLEDHFDTLANGYIGLDFRIELRVYEIGKHAYALVLCGPAALFVQLDNDHRMRMALRTASAPMARVVLPEFLL